MTHCPVCKSEFEELVYVCPECGNHTIFEHDGEEFTLVFNTSMAKDDAEVDEILAFLHYSEMPEAYAEFDDVMETYQIFVHPEHRREAGKLYFGLRKAKEEEAREQKSDGEVTEAEDTDEASCEELLTDADAEENASEEMSEEEEEEPVGVYEDKEAKYLDFHSSGITLLVAGVLVGVFAVLSALKVIPYFSGAIPVFVFSLLAIGFVYAGISSLKRSGEIQYEIREESKSRDIADTWLRENITREMLDALAEEGQPQEITAMKQLEYIGEKLREQFESSEEFLDELAEEYYDELMQDKAE